MIDDNKMIDNMDNMIRAYIALANNTFLSELTTLKDIRIELNKKIAQQRPKSGKKTVRTLRTTKKKTKTKTKNSYVKTT